MKILILQLELIIRSEDLTSYPPLRKRGGSTSLHIQTAYLPSFSVEYYSAITHFVDDGFIADVEEMMFIILMKCRSLSIGEGVGG